MMGLITATTAIAFVIVTIAVVAAEIRTGYLNLRKRDDLCYYSYYS